MSLWCEGFPVVDIPQGSEQKPVTFIYPYYCNRDFLRVQLSWWWTFPAHLRQHLAAIIVDDGSPEKPAEDVLKGYAQPFPIRLFRIEDDVRWNWLAARNIGAHQARSARKAHEPEMWLLLTDMDHVVPQTTAEAVVYGKHDPSLVYAFDRINPEGKRVKKDGKPLGPHSASFLMTGQTYWKIGGYDETASGFYGNDGPYRARIAKRKVKIHVSTDRLILHEFEGDSSTEKHKRKQPEDANRPKWTDPPRVLSFAYHEVTL